MPDYSSLLESYKSDILKALAHLEYSFNKVQRLPTDPSKLDEETLETWESFSSRFARASDIFMTKYLRTYLLSQDPAYEGSLIDSLNSAEKMNLIQSAEQWMTIRSLRNLSAHEYTPIQLEKFFKDLLFFTPQVLNLKKLLDS